MQGPGLSESRETHHSCPRSLSQSTASASHMVAEAHQGRCLCSRQMQSWVRGIISERQACVYPGGKPLGSEHFQQLFLAALMDSCDA